MGPPAGGSVCYGDTPWKNQAPNSYSTGTKAGPKTVPLCPSEVSSSAGGPSLDQGEKREEERRSRAFSGVHRPIHHILNRGIRRHPAAAGRRGGVRSQAGPDGPATLGGACRRGGLLVDIDGLRRGEPGQRPVCGRDQAAPGAADRLRQRSIALDSGKPRTTTPHTGFWPCPARNCQGPVQLTTGPDKTKNGVGSRRVHGLLAVQDDGQ